MAKEKKDKKTSGQNDKKGTKTKRDTTKGKEKKGKNK